MCEKYQQHSNSDFFQFNHFRQNQEERLHVILKTNTDIDIEIYIFQLRNKYLPARDRKRERTVNMVHLFQHSL